MINFDLLIFQKSTGNSCPSSDGLLPSSEIDKDHYNKCDIDDVTGPPAHPPPTHDKLTDGSALATTQHLLLCPIWPMAKKNWPILGSLPLKFSVCELPIRFSF